MSNSAPPPGFTPGAEFGATAAYGNGAAAPAVAAAAPPIAAPEPTVAAPAPLPTNPSPIATPVAAPAPGVAAPAPGVAAPVPAAPIPAVFAPIPAEAPPIPLVDASTAAVAAPAPMVAASTPAGVAQIPALTREPLDAQQLAAQLLIPEIHSANPSIGPFRGSSRTMIAVVGLIAVGLLAIGLVVLGGIGGDSTPSSDSGSAAISDGLAPGSATPNLNSFSATATDAESIVMSATSTIETYATDNGGSYGGATLEQLRLIESSLPTSGLTVSPTETAYTVTATSPEGAQFTVQRSPDGNIVKSCSPASQGSCDASGSW